MVTFTVSEGDRHEIGLGCLLGNLKTEVVVKANRVLIGLAHIEMEAPDALFQQSALETLNQCTTEALALSPRKEIDMEVSGERLHNLCRAVWWGVKEVNNPSIPRVISSLGFWFLSAGHQCVSSQSQNARESGVARI